MEMNQKSKLFYSFRSLLEDMETLKNEMIILEFLAGVLQEYVVSEEQKHAEVVQIAKQDCEKLLPEILQVIQSSGNQMANLMPPLEDPSAEIPPQEDFHTRFQRELKKLDNVLTPFENMKAQFDQTGGNLMSKITFRYPRFELLRKSIKSHIDFLTWDFPQSLKKSVVDCSFEKCENPTVHHVFEEYNRYELKSVCSKISTFLSGMPMEERTLNALESILKSLQVPEADETAAKFWTTFQYFDLDVDKTVVGASCMEYRVEVMAYNMDKRVANSKKTLDEEKKKMWDYIKELKGIFLSMLQTTLISSLLDGNFSFDDFNKINKFP